MQDDDSLRRWKEKLLGCVEGDLNGLSYRVLWVNLLLPNVISPSRIMPVFCLLGQREPEVKFHSIGIISDDIGEITTPLPVAENQSRVLFTLKEGSRYQLKLTFTVLHNIVSGLTYSNTVWKAGLQGEAPFPQHLRFKLMSEKE